MAGEPTGKPGQFFWVRRVWVGPPPPKGGGRAAGRQGWQMLLQRDYRGPKTWREGDSPIYHSNSSEKSRAFPQIAPWSDAGAGGGCSPPAPQEVLCAR